MVTGFLSDNRPMLCGCRCMIVVSCGASWWICGGVSATLAREVALPQFFRILTRNLNWRTIHKRISKTSWRQWFSHASKIALIAQVVLRRIFLRKQSCASYVDTQAKLRASVVDMWGTMWTICAWQTAKLRDSETHYCAFFSWQAYSGYVIITVPVKGIPL